MSEGIFTKALLSNASFVRHATDAQLGTDIERWMLRARFREEGFWFELEDPFNELEGLLAARVPEPICLPWPPRPEDRKWVWTGQNWGRAQNVIWDPIEHLCVRLRRGWHYGDRSDGEQLALKWVEEALWETYGVRPWQVWALSQPNTWAIDQDAPVYGGTDYDQPHAPKSAKETRACWMTVQFNNPMHRPAIERAWRLWREHGPDLHRPRWKAHSRSYFNPDKALPVPSGRAWGPELPKLGTRKQGYEYDYHCASGKALYEDELEQALHRYYIGWTGYGKRTPKDQALLDEVEAVLWERYGLRPWQVRARLTWSDWMACHEREWIADERCDIYIGTHLQQLRPQNEAWSRIREGHFYRIKTRGSHTLKRAHKLWMQYQDSWGCWAGPKPEPVDPEHIEKGPPDVDPLFEA